MRIENLTQTQSATTARVEATIIWEDSQRPTRTVFFETTAAYADALTCDPHAFLTAAVIPAMQHGEKRVKIDAAVCPDLLHGLLTNMSWLRAWYPTDLKRVSLETGPAPWQARSGGQSRSASFLSGGIDSLATLRTNRLAYSSDHPGAIKDCLIVHGFDIGGLEMQGEEEESFQRAIASLQPIASDGQVELIPIQTNIRHLDDDVYFWMYKLHGAALAAVAHAFSRRLGRVYIGSTVNIPYIDPWGSHPLLDPNYSSSNLQTRHDSIRLSRLDKVRVIADWEVALCNLRVCTMNPPDQLNCGKCEKCIRTMTELLALGKLAQAASFPVHDVSPELLNTIEITTDHQEAWYLEMIEPLAARGRPDLVEAIKRKSSEFRRHLAWDQEKDWKGTVKRFDRKYLGSSMYKSYKSLRALSNTARNG
jgi:hypothetical protein